MKHESRSRKVWGWLFTLSAAVLLVSVAFAQEPPPAPGAAPKAGSVSPGSTVSPSTATTDKKLRGRLPAYYGQVVSDKQRTEIYEIQAKYNQQIEKLKDELEALTTKRDAEVEQVLTDEQRAEITQLKEARTVRRGSSATAPDAPGDN